MVDQSKEKWEEFFGEELLSVYEFHRSKDIQYVFNTKDNISFSFRTKNDPMNVLTKARVAIKLKEYRNHEEA